MYTVPNVDAGDYDQLQQVFSADWYEAVGGRWVALQEVVGCNSKHKLDKAPT